MENNQRLIDANKLMVCTINTGTVMFPRMEGFVRVEDIAAAPIVDAVEVVHTRFVDGECTNCGWFGDCVDTLNYNFCPGCGAKADGGANAENGAE